MWPWAFEAEVLVESLTVRFAKVPDIELHIQSAETYAILDHIVKPLGKSNRRHVSHVTSQAECAHNGSTFWTYRLKPVHEHGQILIPVW